MVTITMSSWLTIPVVVLSMPRPTLTPHWAAVLISTSLMKRTSRTFGPYFPSLIKYWCSLWVTWKIILLICLSGFQVISQDVFLHFCLSLDITICHLKPLWKVHTVAIVSAPLVHPRCRATSVLLWSHSDQERSYQRDSEGWQLKGVCVFVLFCCTGAVDLTALTVKVTEVTLITGVPAKAADTVENVPLFLIRIISYL